jgi:hypothetical protein
MAIDHEVYKKINVRNFMEAQLRYRKDLNSSVFGAGPAKPKKRKAAAVKREPASEVPVQATPKPIPRIDFVKRNIDDAAYSRNRQKVVPCVSKKETVVNAIHEPGSIPRGVANRKREILAAKMPRKESECPEGMRMLSEDEKLESLDALGNRKEEIEETLGHAPLRIESQSLIRQHRELEQELQDIDRSMDQLKRKYVFVPE